MDSGGRIMFSLAQDGETELGVFDVRGARVATLISGQLPAGVHRVVWDGRDASGKLVPVGLYVFELRQGSLRRTGRIIVLR
jgi:flagellar hook assembly protein FlgD